MFKLATLPRVLLSAVLTLGVFAKPAVAGPKFQEPLALEATVNVYYEKDLRNLLVQPGKPPYQWVTKGLPPGITLDEANNKISGTPTQLGTYDLVFSVQDDSGEGGDANHPGKFTVLPAAPVWTQTTIDFGLQNEDSPWSFDLKPFLKDPGVVTSYEATNLPGWMKLDNKTGVITGTPRRPDVKKYKDIGLSAVGAAGTAKATAYGEVLINIKPPHWKQNPIGLSDVDEEKPFQFDLTQYVDNPEGTALVYKIVTMTAPSWLKVGDASGTLFGTPPKEGKVEVVVSLETTIDGTFYTDSTTVKFNILNVNKAPRWKANPINLGKAFTGVAFSQSLASSAEEPDGEKITFSMTGPNWAKLNADTGVFSGTPGKSDIGTAIIFQATISDPAGLSDTTTLVIDVIKSNEPPVWNDHPIVLPDGFENKSYEVDLSKYASDPDGDKLFFKKLDDTPFWPSIDSTGTLVGKPTKDDIGFHKFKVSVTDNISGSDVVEVHILVQNVNDPPTWIMNPIQFTVDEDSNVSKDLAAYVTDPDTGDSLTFTLKSGPQWGSVSATGIFQGIPRTPDVGQNNFVVTAMDKSGLTSDVDVIVTVKPVNHPPKWTQNPVILLEATEEDPYTASLKEFAVDQDANDILKFFKIATLPAWVKVDSDGTVSGTPQRPDIGMNSFEVRVYDKMNAEAVATIKINVKKKNHAPRWRQNPVVMNDGWEDTDYRFSLKIYAVDDDGDTLKFEKTDGPGWIFVGEDGSITGLPPSKSAGDYTLKFKVTDPGGLSAETGGVLEIIKKEHPPVIDPAMPQFTVKERAVVSWSIAQYVTDQDGDKVTFELIDTADWLTLSADGTINAKPIRKDVGPHRFNFKVNDGKLMTTGILKIAVLKDPRAPEWLFEPIATFEAKTNLPFNETVRDRARDLDGSALKFYKVSGPTWLVVNTDGTLSGKPLDPDLGEEKFTLRVTNSDNLSDDGTLVINVKPGIKTEKYAIDKAHPGAPAELLWVIDNSDPCGNLLKSVKNNMQVFYNELNTAEIHHSGIVLSSDVEEFKADPIKEKNGPMLQFWNDANWVKDFQRRVDLAFSPGFCHNCNSSPIWAKYRFFEKIPNITEIYHNGYMMAEVPADTLIVTPQMDHYKRYTKSLPEPLKSYQAKDFVKDFVAFHKKESKTYRISVVAPATNALIEASGDPSSAPETNAYQVLVDKTAGKYYGSTCQQINAADVLKDYAQRVIFRATVHANNRYVLTQKPIDFKSVKVTLGSTLLNGNTGNPEDVWTYDSSKNEVVIYWFKIDEGQLKPGDTLYIEYRVN